MLLATAWDTFDVTDPIARGVAISGLFDLHRQQAALADAWALSLHDMRVVEMPGLTHYDVIDHLGRPGSALHRAVMAQVEDAGPRAEA